MTTTNQSGTSLTFLAEEGVISEYEEEWKQACFGGHDSEGEWVRDSHYSEIDAPLLSKTSNGRTCCNSKRVSSNRRFF